MFRAHFKHCEYELQHFAALAVKTWPIRGGAVCRKRGREIARARATPQTPKSPCVRGLNFKFRQRPALGLKSHTKTLLLLPLLLPLLTSGQSLLQNALTGPEAGVDW